MTRGARFTVSLAAALVVIELGCGKAGAVDETKPPPPLGDNFADGLSPACAKIYSKDWRPVGGRDKQRPASLPKPARGVPFADAAYKTCIVRVTDHAADHVPGFARNDYSRRQAFNADNSKIVISASDGTWHYYDVAARRYLGKLEGLAGDAEPQWHPTDPNRMYYFPAFGIGMQIKEIDVRTGKSRVVADLAKRIKAIWPNANSAWTKDEGSPSADARYWALMVDSADWKGIGMLTYDLANDKILATYDFAEHKKGRPDHLSMSPSGNYVVVSWDDGPTAFTRDLATSQKLAHKGEHSDIAIDANGDDTYVSVDYEASGGPVYMTNLRTGTRTPLFPTYLDHTATAMHFSGKAFQRRGWVLMSTYAESGGAWQWLHGKIFAVELKDHPRVIDLAHHHVAYNEYFTEPHASVNRDFTRVAFGSNWETKSKTDIDTYVIELPKALLSP